MPDLIQSLQNRDIGHLRIVAELWGVELRSGETEAALKELCAALHVPALSAYGVTRDDFTAIIEKSSQASSMKGNPIQLTNEEMREILERAV